MAEITLEKLRDELVKNALQIRRGEITPQQGNAVANSLRGAIYAEQTKIQSGAGTNINVSSTTELSQEDKNRLDEIAKLLGSHPKEEKDDKSEKS